MSMKVKREQLQHALEMVSPGLSTKETVDQSNNFCFKDGKVFTYDDETACIMDSPINITGSVPAEPLRQLLGKLKEKDLEITIENGKFKIKGKGQHANINMESKIELPIENLEIPKKWNPLPAKFAEALRQVSRCAGRNENEFNLTCVHLHKKWIEAFDTYQFARYKIKLGLTTNTLVRQVSIKHLINLEMSEFAETDQWLHFRNGAGLIFACRRFTDKYDDLEDIASVSGKKIQLPKGLVDATDLAQIFSVKTDKDNNVRVDLKPGWIKVKGEGMHGEYQGRRKLKYSGEPLSFLVHPEMLIQLIKDHTECEICTGKIKALKAELGNFMFVTSLTDPQEVDQRTQPEVIPETNGKPKVKNATTQNTKKTKAKRTREGSI